MPHGGWPGVLPGGGMVTVGPPNARRGAAAKSRDPAEVTFPWKLK